LNSLQDVFAAIGAALDERDARLMKRLDALEEKIAPRPVPPPAPAQKRYLRINDAAKLIGMSPSWLRKAARQRSGPPRFRAGKCIIYDAEQLVAWLSALK
jgi:predicted DNA-binding transcriptional regulator AlpA